MKGPALFQGEIIREQRKYIDEIFKNLLLRNYWTNFNQTWHKTSLGEGDSSLLKRRTTSFPRGDYYEIAKIHGRNLKIFFSRTTGPILTKLGTKHPWVKRNYAREIIIKLLKYIPEK